MWIGVSFQSPISFLGSLLFLSHGNEVVQSLDRRLPTLYYLFPTFLIQMSSGSVMRVNRWEGVISGPNPVARDPNPWPVILEGMYLIQQKHFETGGVKTLLRLPFSKCFCCIEKRISGIKYWDCDHDDFFAAIVSQIFNLPGF